jgi:hypothetical protein
VIFYALHLGDPLGTHLAAWLHWAIRGLFWATVTLYGLAAAVCLWVFSNWFFAAWQDLGGSDAPAAVAIRQARLRGAIADMIWRSKYAVLILVLYGALVLAMDQTRDALLRQIVDVGSAPLAGQLKTALGIVIAMVALTLLARASWLWPRLILRLRAPDANARDLPAAQAFAKWWCRILGLVPFGVVAIMIAITLRELPSAQDHAGRWLALMLGLILVAAAVFLGRVAYRLPAGAADYYDCADDAAAARDDLGIIPLAVAWGAPATFLLARFCGLMEWTPPLALAVITAALATWAGILGWIAYQSRRFAIPYLLLFVALVGMLGVLDLTDAHRVRLWAENVAPLDAAGLHALFGMTTILFALGIALAWHWSRERTSGVARIVSGVLAMLAVMALLKIHDVNPAAPADPSTRPDMPAALSSWLNQLPDAAWQPTTDPADRYTVFVISSEGGGIRSAYWTALVLWRMKFGIEDFDRRTFALSGVSGGALGVAVYRACSDEANATRESMKACIDRFGYADLWTQLLGGMFFEDAVATVVPTRFCREPGCGVLGRSLWFEGAMEAAVPGLAERLGAARDARPFTPHLFLNVTQVETGERALESDVKIDAAQFPDAADLLALAQADMRLSTAAHNSARFPYTNPVGALYGRTCPRDPRADEPPALKKRAGLCTHLQDGGYFDDSAAATASDLLRALRGCLDGPSCVASRTGHPSIKPVVIEIRNEGGFPIPPDRPQPPICTRSARWPFDPGHPDIQRPLKVFPLVIAAPLTLFNTRLAHLRNFEGELERDADAAWLALGLAPPPDDVADCKPNLADWIGDRPIHRFDLVDDGTLYPEGWMLSAGAMQAMCTQASGKLPYPALGSPAPDDCSPKVARKW